MTLLPILERLFLRDLIGRGEREGRKIEEVHEKVQFKAGILLARKPRRSLDHQLLSLAIDPYRQKFLLLSRALAARAKFH
jgi:hypothetical protein